MTDGVSTRNLLLNIVTIASAVLAIYVAFVYGRLHLDLLLHSGTHEYREGSTLVTTQYLLDGKNPYSTDFLPASLNVYGIAYNIFVYPFARFFGNTFLVHRSVTGLFVLGICALVYRILRLRGCNRIDSSLGIVILYAILASNYSVIARPDYLGAFFFLLSLYFPWAMRFGRYGLFLGGLSALLAFLAKPYFLLSIAIVSAFLFVNRPKIVAIIYFIFSISLFYALLKIISYEFPYYYYSTVTISYYTQSLGFSHLLQQIVEFSALHIGFMIIALGTAMSLASSRDRYSRPTLKQLDFLNLAKPLSALKIDYFLIATLISFTALLYLAQHRGAYLVYFIHLLSPLLLIYTLSIKMPARSLSLVKRAGLLLNLLTLAVALPSHVASLNDVEPVISDLFSKGKRSLVNPLLVEYTIGARHEFYSSGQTNYFVYPAIEDPEQYREPKKLYSRYLDKIKAKIINGEYEHIFTDVVADQEMPLVPIIRKHYAPAVKIQYPLYFRNWKDRNQFGEGSYEVVVWSRLEARENGQ